MSYTQCKLSKRIGADRIIEEIGLIPTPFAKVGERVRWKDSDGWVIEKVIREIPEPPTVHG